MQATLAELAALVGGDIIGDGQLVIHGAATLRDAKPGQITLVDQSEKNRRLDNCMASAAIAPRNFSPECISVIQVDDIHQAFAMILRHFCPPREATRIGISPMAAVSPTAKIGKNVDIHPFATVGDHVVIGDGSTIHSGAHIMSGSQVGEDVTIFPNVVLYENTIVGPRCLIHANAVLGAYGFGYGFADGRHVLSAQLGNVELGAEVEVRTAVARLGTSSFTVRQEAWQGGVLCVEGQVVLVHFDHVGRQALPLTPMQRARLQAWM